MKRLTIEKIQRRLHGKLLNILGIYIYPSYWNYKLHGSVDNPKTSDFYLAARPNPGAGIGHQMANWIAGLWWSKQFGLKFAHIGFSTDKWEKFLGFGEGEITVSELKKAGWKIRRIPLFNENRPETISIIKGIMSSYGGKKVVFLCEQDQFYKDQHGVMEEIQQKFYRAPARKNDHLIYDKNNINIAIHVRRGDIMADPSNPNLAMRYLSNDYFEKVLAQVYSRFSAGQAKPIHIYFFSQGTPEDYPEFSKYPNLHWCMEMGAQDSFLHMVYADVLITSKSSFSYKPALLNRGIKVCPRDFWHGYPNAPGWVMAENDGLINESELKKLNLIMK